MLNLKGQQYKKIKLCLVEQDYSGKKAKKFAINDTYQNVWIPNKHLSDDGTIKDRQNLDYIFKKEQHKLRLAGVGEKYIIKE